MLTAEENTFFKQASFDLKFENFLPQLCTQFEYETRQHKIERTGFGLNWIYHIVSARF